jgi:hypothetical protein
VAILVPGHECGTDKFWRAGAAWFGPHEAMKGKGAVRHPKKGIAKLAK